MDREVWEIRLSVVSTEDQVDMVKERIAELMCPDPDHAPPCPIPWQIAARRIGQDEIADYSVLLEQADLEG